MSKITTMRLGCLPPLNYVINIEEGFLNQLRDRDILFRPQSVINFGSLGPLPLGMQVSINQNKVAINQPSGERGRSLVSESGEFPPGTIFFPIEPGVNGVLNSGGREIPLAILSREIREMGRDVDRILVPQLGLRERGVRPIQGEPINTGYGKVAWTPIVKPTELKGSVVYASNQGEFTRD